jgi:WD40 repeat protein
MVIGVVLWDQYRSLSMGKIEREAQAQVVAANEALFNQTPAEALKRAVQALKTTNQKNYPPVEGAVQVLKRSTLAAPSVVLGEPEELVRAVAWSPDGRRLASVGDDRLLLVWDYPLTPTREPRRFVAKAALLSLSWKPDGTKLATSDAQGRVEVWTLDNHPAVLLGKLTDRASAVAWHPDGSLLVAADEKGWIRVWKDETLLKDFRGSESPIWSLAWSPVSHQFAAGYRYSQITFWDGETGGKLGVIGTTGAIRSLHWTADGKKIVSGAQDWNARIWDVSTGTQIGRHIDHRGIVSTARWGPQTRRDLLATSSDFGVKVVRILPDGEYNRLAEFGLNTESVYSLGWSPDGQYLAAGLYGKIHLYALDVLNTESVEDWLKAAEARLGQ